MKFKELKNRSAAELQKILTELREKLRDLKFKVASKQLKNVREIRQVKKTIAKIMFLLNQTKSNVKSDDKGATVK